MTRHSHARDEFTEQDAERGRRAIGSYPTYGEAERAVDHLSDQRFPVERTAIIGHDVRMVEQVIGRLNYGGAALRGAGAGAVTGALLGWLFGLFSWVQPLLASVTLALYGLVFGAVIGALLGMLMHALQRGRRDFAATRVMMPSRYEVVVDADLAVEAEQMLAAWQGHVRGQDPTAPEPRTPG
jgi:hypothetical protein